MIKLCVGADTIADLREWRRSRGDTGPWILHTRQTPKRAGEMINGGSLYRVFKGVILCRQAIEAVSTVGEGPSKRCEINLGQDIVLVTPTPRRAFQGWRYLPPDDAPADLATGADDAVPQGLALQLRELGAW